MSKSLQILLACIIAACLLLGYLVSLMLGPAPGADRGRTEGDSPAGRSVHWPLPAAGAYRRAVAEQGRQVFLAKGCWQCHALGNDPLPGEVNPTAAGPDLAFVGDRLSVDEIIESIVNPNAVIAGPVAQNSVDGSSKMPSAVENLSTGDLMRLAVFLADRHAGAELPVTPVPPPPSPLPSGPETAPGASPPENPSPPPAAGTPAPPAGPVPGNQP